ncbi:hypothetical protein L210DRAFT_3533887 [Boletus edulis BED1]|uniref:Uncharacterized protein n=1 Tax=Boletus edulis BED1 TaxID=1328754 RepID=A0AAD4BZS5_BOLED|nr:hypothetical protein L210DRAFT_3533887 [Boletus edulis BED1]
MTPLDRFQAGIWKASLDALDTPSTTTLALERLPTVNHDSDAAPALRIQATMPLRKLYIHAGCPASGRLATDTWYRLADAPAQHRGGTAIATVTLTPDSELVLIRFGGFSGFQLPQVTWGTPRSKSIRPAQTPARSVRGLISFVTRTNATLERIPVALLHHGERGASSVGHAGASLLLVTPTLAFMSIPTLEWKKLRVEGT